MSEQLWKSLSDNGLALTIAGCALIAVGYLFIQTVIVLRSFLKSDGIVVRWFERNNDSQDVISKAVDKLPIVLGELKTVTISNHASVIECAKQQTDILDKILLGQTKNFAKIDEFHDCTKDPSHPFCNWKTHKGLRQTVLAAKHLLDHYATSHPNAVSDRDILDARNTLQEAERYFSGDK